MTGRTFQDIWKEQCEAARGVREQHGVVSALDDLLGEKLMTYAETAVGRPEFARELPGSWRRSGASSARRRLYLEHLERMDAQEEEALSAEPADDDFMIETPEQRTARRARLARLKELLTASVLGRGERFARSSGKQVKAREQCGRQARHCSPIHQERARRHSCSQCSKGQT